MANKHFILLQRKYRFGDAARNPSRASHRAWFRISSFRPPTSWSTTTPGHGPPCSGVATNTGKSPPFTGIAVSLMTMELENIVTGVTANSAARTIILYGAVSLVFSSLPYTATMHRHSYDRQAAQSFRKLKAIGVHQGQPDEAVRRSI